MLQTVFIQRAPKGQSKGTVSHSKGTWALKAHGHSSTCGTRARDGHLCTRALKALGSSDTWALKENLDTLALEHVGT